jgi:hypothetical protein
MLIFGWQRMKQAALYTKAAKQKRLAGAAMSMISFDQNANKILSPLPEVQER